MTQQRFGRGRDAEFLRARVRTALPQGLEAEMTGAIGAAKGERTPARLGDRSGDDDRPLITRVGTLERRAPQGSVLDRAVRALPALGTGTGGGLGGNGTCRECRRAL